MIRTLVVGLGSPHGDDRGGWQVVEALRQSVAVVETNLEIITLSDPSQLWGRLEGWQRLIVIDASRAGRAPGTIVRLDCSRDRGVLEPEPGQSSHGLGLRAILDLAHALGSLPAEVIVFAIEAGSCLPGEEISPAVAAALPVVRETVVREILDRDTSS